MSEEMFHQDLALARTKLTDEIESLRSQLTAANERAEKAERDLATWREAMRLLSAGQLADELASMKEKHRLSKAMSEQVWSNHQKQFNDLTARAESAETSLAAAQKEIGFYKKSLERIANEFGITHPIQLIARSETNEETYVDILIKVIRLALTPKPEAKG